MLNDGSLSTKATRVRDTLCCSACLQMLACAVRQYRYLTNMMLLPGTSLITRHHERARMGSIL